MAKKKPSTSVHVLPVLLGAITAIGVAYLVPRGTPSDAFIDIPTTITPIEQPAEQAPGLAREEGLINWVKDRGGRVSCRFCFCRFIFISRQFFASR